MFGFIASDTLYDASFNRRIGPQLFPAARFLLSVRYVT